MSPVPFVAVDPIASPNVQRRVNVASRHGKGSIGAESVGLQWDAVTEESRFAWPQVALCFGK